MRNGHEIAKLIEPGRVHRSVYTDPELFELEMERIFGRAWLFVGHESQVPHAGDYITTELGRQPVIMVRHRDGSINVLLNRCTHRGAKVVNERKGNAARLTCCYHGWSFDTDGRLAAVPVPEGCAADFDQAAFGLARAPRVGEYRGFVFASLAAKGASFEDHIGPMKRNIDDLVDRAPGGALALDAGMHRYAYNGNWKLQVENVLDSYHVPFGHASTINKQGVQFARREGDRQGATVVETEKTQTAASWKERKSYIAGNGHGWTSNTSLDEGKRSSRAFDEYKRVLAEEVGAERGATDSHPAPAQFADLSQRVDHGAQHPCARHQAGRGRPHRGHDLSHSSHRRAAGDEFRQCPFAQRDALGVVVRADRRSRVLRARAEGAAQLRDRLGRYLARAGRGGGGSRA
jgi:benzoate/toluate 1,2-dioxygenase subunit alpha